MILNKKPLSLAEVGEYAKEGSSEVVIEYLKKFKKGSPEKAKSIRESMASLQNPKIKEDHIVKVIDMLPKDQEDVNKIFFDSNLNEEEAKAILEIVKSN